MLRGKFNIIPKFSKFQNKAILHKLMQIRIRIIKKKLQTAK